VLRGAPSSFDDHFSQPAMFYASLSADEQKHVAEAYTFELGKVYEMAIKERALTVLAQIDTALCAAVAEGLGLEAPKGTVPEHLAPSPALAQITGETFPVDGRIVAIVAGPDADVAGITALRTALEAAGAVAKVVAPVGGELGSGTSKEIIERTYLTARSIEFDAVVVADGAPKEADLKAVLLMQESFRQLKAIGAWGDGTQVLTATGIDTGGPGVLTADSAASLAGDLIAAMGLHRVWERAPLVTASAVPPVS